MRVARIYLIDWQAADDALASLEDRHADGAAYYIAVTHAWRSETEEAFAWLKRAVEEDQSTFGIRTEPFLRVLHEDPRWEQMLDRLGLAADPGRGYRVIGSASATGLHYAHGRAMRCTC